ncbi:MAG: transcriptional regulator [Bacilli bacterium]|nr:transcriptional regulator [Bacilli bacterium]
MNGEFLYKRRIELGFSQTKVAEYLGYSTQTISLWENDKSSPNMLIWAKLAALYELDLEGLLYDKVQKKNNNCIEKSFDPDKYASNLRRLRKNKGLTQSQVAAKIGTPPNAIIRFEQGTSSPDIGQFLTLCDLLQVNPDDFYFVLNVVPPSTVPKSRVRLWSLIIVLSALTVTGGALGTIFGVKNAQNRTAIPEDSSSQTSTEESSASIDESEETSSETSSSKETLSSESEEIIA